MTGGQKARLTVLVCGILFIAVPVGVELYYILAKRTIFVFLPFLIMLPGGVGALFAVFSKKTNWSQYD